MFRSASYMFLCFMIGFAFVAGMDTHRALSTPLLPAISEATVDASSVCVMAEEMLLKKTNCQAFQRTKSISFDMDSSVSQASKVCRAIAAQSSGFAGMGWTLRIYTPYNKTTPEICVLR